MADAIEFDWDAHNEAHLRLHHVSAVEFEEVICGDPLDMEYQVESGEDRYKSLGATARGRVLIVVWTVRDGKVRAVTAYDAGKSYERLYAKVKR